MRDLSAAVTAVIDGLGDGDLAIPDVVRTVRRLHPEVCAAAADEAIDREITAMVRRRCKPSDADSPRLPGFDLPARLPIAVEAGFVWRATRRCTEADFDAYEALLIQGIADDRAALAVFRKEKKRVVKLLRSAGVATLAELPS
jgi:hypothetical protein